MHGVRSTEAWNRQVGQLCLLGGFPCRIASVRIAHVGKHGHAKRFVFGVGLFDNRKHTEVFDPSHSARIPMFVKTVPLVRIIWEFFFAISNLLGGLDYDHRPQDNDHFVLKTVSSSGQQDHQVTTTAIWGIDKIQSLHPEACYQYFLREREASTHRERHKEVFYTFLATIARAQETSAVLGHVELRDVLQNTLECVIGSQSTEKKFGDEAGWLAVTTAVATVWTMNPFPQLTGMLS